MSNVRNVTTESLMATIRDLERRIRALESAPRIPHTSLSQGSLIVYDENGDDVVTVGKLYNGKYGLAVNTGPGGITFLSDTDGLALPFYAAPFRIASGAPDSSGAVKVTSTSFVTVYRTVIELLQWDAVRVRVPAQTNGAETGEVRLRNLSNGNVTAAVPVSSAGGLFDFRWLHGGEVGTGPWFFAVEARVTSGTGVWVWNPDGGAVFYRGDFMIPPATTTGRDLAS